VRGLASLAEAGPGDLSFLANARYASQMAGTRAAAVLVAPDWRGTCPATLVRTPNPDRTFADAAALLGPAPAPRPAGVHPTAVVSPQATVDASAHVGPLCVVESGAHIGARSVLVAGCYVGPETVVGNDCLLHPLSSVRERCRLGNRVILHNGAVIGSDGFGYTREGSAWRKTPQIGIVELGDDVEIGANATVDRARFGRTVLERGVKIDNLVQIAHNVRIGEHCALAAQCGIAGSARLGAGVQMAGQVGVIGHVEVGAGVIVGGQAGVTKDVPPGAIISGYPAMPHAEARRLHAHLKRLPEWKERVAQLEARLAAIEKRMEGGGA
jgi:UDP-3-O-[3-hydroxymyristoyl] glucosamine N-acyltransferase